MSVINKATISGFKKKGGKPSEEQLVLMKQKVNGRDLDVVRSFFFLGGKVLDPYKWRTAAECIAQYDAISGEAYKNKPSKLRTKAIIQAESNFLTSYMDRWSWMDIAVAFAPTLKTAFRNVDVENKIFMHNKFRCIYHSDNEIWAFVSDNTKLLLKHVANWKNPAHQEKINSIVIGLPKGRSIIQKIEIDDFGSKVSLTARDPNLIKAIAGAYQSLHDACKVYLPEGELKAIDWGEPGSLSKKENKFDQVTNLLNKVTRLERAVAAGANVAVDLTPDSNWASFRLP